MESNFQHAMVLRNKGELEKSKEVLLKLLQTDPNDATLIYECGLANDMLGLEREAIPLYLEAIQLGLNEDRLKDAYVCLGSSYRVIGQFEESFEVLKKGYKQFPNYRPIQIFLSLTLHKQQKYSEAMEIVLKNLIDTTVDGDLKNYSRAVRYYAENLD